MALMYGPEMLHTLILKGTFFTNSDIATLYTVP
jgi:hypothetical protein